MRLWGSKDEPVDAEAVKARSMAEVTRLGGRTIAHLPIIDPTTARAGEALAQRALILNALVGLAYEAPVPLLRGWVAANGLTSALSNEEARLLQKETGDLTQQETIDAGWSIEALHALLWAGGFVPVLPLDGQLAMEGLARLPKVGAGESGQDFARRVRLRPYAELYAMRDLYYRAHWYARDGDLKGEETGVFDGGSIMERRKALEWLLDETVNWDDVELGT